MKLSEWTEQQGCFTAAFNAMCTFPNVISILLNKDITKYQEEFKVDPTYISAISAMNFYEYQGFLGVTKKHMLTKTVVEIFSELSTEYAHLNAVLNVKNIVQLIQKDAISFDNAIAMTTAALLSKTTNTSLTKLRYYQRFKGHINSTFIKLLNRTFFSHLNSVNYKNNKTFGLKQKSLLFLTWEQILDYLLKLSTISDVTDSYNKAIYVYRASHTIESIVNAFNISKSSVQNKSLLYVSTDLLGLSIMQIKQKSNFSTDQLDVLSRTTPADLSWLGFQYFELKISKVEDFSKDAKVALYTSSLSYIATKGKLNVLNTTVLDTLTTYSGQSDGFRFIGRKLMAVLNDRKYLPDINKVTFTLNDRIYRMYPSVMKESEDLLSSLKIINLIMKMYQGKHFIRSNLYIYSVMLIVDWVS